jgi:hypothetical protein
VDQAFREIPEFRGMALLSAAIIGKVALRWGFGLPGTARPFGQSGLAIIISRAGRKGGKHR